MNKRMTLTGFAGRAASLRLLFGTVLSVAVTGMMLPGSASAADLPDTSRQAVAASNATAPGATLPATAPDIRVPPYERVQLDNGAVLLLMERDDVPLIAFNAVLRGGALTDPAGAEGTASVLAGLLEKGAGKRDAAAFAEAVADVGGQIRTGASTESITVSGSFLARDAALMVELLADVLQRPQLDAGQFSSLRDRYIEFIRAAKDSNRSALTGIYGNAMLYGEHPYGRPVDGSEASLARLQHAAVRSYYQDHVGADRLILAVAGDFKTAEMKQALQRAFADWRKTGAALPKVAPPTRAGKPRVLLIDAPDAVQSYFWAADLGVARNDPRRATLDVVNTLFGGSFTSMLNSELRVRTGLSYGASSSFDRLSMGGAWVMSSFTRTETTIEAIDLALATLNTLHQGDLPVEQLQSGQRYVLGQFPLGLETAAQWAGQLASLAFYDLPDSYIQGYGAALQAVTPAQARQAITAAVPPANRLTLVVIGKADAIRKELAKYGPVTEMKLADPSFQPPSR